MVDANGANSEALGGRRGSGRLQRGGSLQKMGAARKPRPSGQQGCALQSAWRLLSNGWKCSKTLGDVWHSLPYLHSGWQLAALDGMYVALLWLPWIVRSLWQTPQSACCLLQAPPQSARSHQSPQRQTSAMATLHYSQQVGHLCCRAV